jgi:hypothetical protein
MRTSDPILDFGFWILDFADARTPLFPDIKSGAHQAAHQAGFWIGKTFLCLDFITSSIVIVF